MTVENIIRNGNYQTEFSYVVRIVDEYGESVLEFESWEDYVPEEVMEAEVVWLTVVNGYGTMFNEPVMVIDVNEIHEMY